MGKKRKGISKRTRFEVFKRDGFKCQYCGQTPPQIILQIDHILAVANGGGDEETNLLTSCEDCNNGKSDKPLTAVPEAIEIQLRRQVDRREQLEAYNAWLMEARQRMEDEGYRLGVYWCDQTHAPDQKGKWVVSQPRLSSIRTFLKSLPAAEVYDAMDIALSRMPATYGDEKTWKYFCGVCWRKIKKDGRDGQS
jgi:hypothetical protein